MHSPMSDEISHHESEPALIRAAHPSEAEMVAALVRAAFMTVAEEIGIDIPPLHETADDVRVTFSAGDAVLVAVIEGIVVGTVRGETMSSGDIMVRRLAVLPSHRGHGIARDLMLALEGAYPDARRFELFTGADAAGPLALYESLGYQLMKQSDEVGVALVYLEKCR
jgi:GNAT superfamily N-acetyltransferase